MKHDYSIAVLEGEGQNDYTRYMRTDTLLSLQRTPQQMIHHDELLFQTVHQSTELWLKHACYEMQSGVEHIQSNEIEHATAMVERAVLGMELITRQLEMLSFITPADFQSLRTVLGNGSGFESPGWQSVQKVSGKMNHAFTKLCETRKIDLVELYKGCPHDPVYRLAEALISWDERVTLWRVRHFRVAIRTIGISAVGTKGTPVDQLYKLITRKYFPVIWQVRTELTLNGPLGDLEPAEIEDVV